MLSEISQSEKDKHYMVSFIWGIQKIVKGNKGKRRENEWEISERVTEHERLLTLGNEQEMMEMEDIMLSGVSQSEKDKHYMVSFIWGI